MAVFQYTAKDVAGNEFAGTYTDIDNRKALKKCLSKMGYTLVKATRETGIAGKKTRLSGRARSSHSPMSLPECTLPVCQ